MASALPAEPGQLRVPKQKGCRIIQYDPTRAARRHLKRKRGADDYANVAVDGHGLISAIPLKPLKDADAIRALYEANGDQPTVDLLYNATDEEHQAAARAILRDQGLDDGRDRARARKRWTIAWRADGTKSRSSVTQRTLYQCSCGYKHESKFHPSLLSYTGCLAHVEVTTHEASSTVLRIRGHLEHNDACKEAKAALPSSCALQTPDACDIPPVSSPALAHSEDAEATTASASEHRDIPGLDLEDSIYEPHDNQQDAHDHVSLEPEPHEQPPPELATHLTYLRTTLDSFAGYLASLPNGTNDAREGLEQTLASMDALAAQLRRLAS